MALSNEDKKDVAGAFGKKAAGAVSKATHDNADWALGGSHAPSRGWGAHKDKTGKQAKSKALKSKTGGKWQDPGIQAMKRGVSFGDPR